MPEKIKAILFGAIGTLTETSDMQRQSYNAAFRDAGLDWNWSAVDYARMLRDPGGKARIAAFARMQGQEVDAEAVHAAKVAHFRARAEEGLTLRPGVAQVIARAREAGTQLAFVTGTGRETVDLVLRGLGARISRADFAFIGNADLASNAKPHPQLYEVALASLGLVPGAALAVEDTPESAAAALAAGVACIGFPGTAARDRVFPDKIVHVVEQLQPALFGLDD